MNKIEVKLNYIECYFKMPATRAIQIERLVKRVENAINNPVIDYNGVKDALAELKASNIRSYHEDHDHWVRLAISSGDERKLCCLFGNIKVSALVYLFNKSPSYMPLYMKSHMFNPNKPVSLYYSDHYQHDSDISDIVYNSSVSNNPTQYYYNNDIAVTTIKPDVECEKRLTIFFQQPKSWPILQRLVEKKYYRKYMKVNPVAKKRKHLAKVLLRFWLVTTKSLLQSWKESLYAPGTGAFYKIAEASFKRDL
jgi:hypothetical protein